MINDKEHLLSILKAADFPYVLYEHAPVFTVDDMHLCKDIPGAHVKNLFLRDRKKTAYVLLTVKDDKRVDLLSLGKTLQLDRLSFASSNDLIEKLNVQPGSVTPFAILNDQSKKITFFMDDDLLQEEYISVHPMENTATIRMKLADLLRFIEHSHGKKIEFMKL